LPRRAGEADVDGVVRQAFVAIALGHFTGEHATAGAIGIANDGLKPHWRATVKGGLRFRDELAI
jgi:hypothetical protein